MSSLQKGLEQHHQFQSLSSHGLRKVRSYPFKISVGVKKCMCLLVSGRIGSTEAMGAVGHVKNQGWPAPGMLDFESVLSPECMNFGL